MAPIKPDSLADTSPSTAKRNKRVFEETAASSRPKRGAAGPPTKRTRSSAVGTNGNGDGTAVASASASAVARKKDGGKATKGKGKVAKNAVPAKARAPAAPAAKKPGRPTKTNTGGRSVSNAGAGGTAKEVEDPPASNGAVEENEVDDDEDGRSYWLMKAEPESRMEKGVDVKFSIDDLREAEEPEPWDGVRNAAARNHMRAMKKGDLAFFYHSNCKVPGIAGIMEIVHEHSIDESAFDKAHPYYDPKSSRANPKWEVVHVEFRRKFKELVRLSEIKSFAKPGDALEDLSMVKQGRLSVSPVTPKQWRFIMGLAEEFEEDGDKKE